MRKHCTRLFLIVALAMGLLAPQTAQAISFADIEFWVGEGPNQTALVLDWKDGAFADSALAWGYRWDPAAASTAQDMLVAIAGPTEVRDNVDLSVVLDTFSGADPRLGLEIVRYGFGDALYGIGYDIDDDGGFQYAFLPGEAGTALDPDDLYTEGWNFSGYMSYFTGNGPDTDGVDWEPSWTGMGATPLADGDWHAFVWDLGFAGAIPSQAILPALPGASAAAVPEPATCLLLAAGLAAAARRRRRTH